MGDRVRKPDHPLHCWSVGQVIRGLPVLIEASPIFLPQPIPLCWGQVVPAWGTCWPFPVVQCAGVNIEPSPLADAC